MLSLTHPNIDVLESIIKRELIPGLDSADRKHPASLLPADAPLLDPAVWLAAVVHKSHAPAKACGVDHFICVYLQHVGVLSTSVTLYTVSTVLFDQGTIITTYLTAQLGLPAA
jgi:hypothetical protein